MQSGSQRRLYSFCQFDAGVYLSMSPALTSVSSALTSLAYSRLFLWTQFSVFIIAWLTC